MSHREAERAILERERGALERWSQGDPMGYPEIQTEDVSYFDDIGAHSRIDGRDAVRAYMSSLRGKIPPHRFEIVDPRVQLYGDVGILTLHYRTRDAEGDPLTPWKATSIYRRTDRVWRIAHAHWSIVKPG